MTETLRILMLEDNPADAALIEHALRKAGMVFEALRVERRDEFIAALSEFHPDLVLADYQLPEFDGLKALAIVREDHPHLPFVFVTGAMGEDRAVESLRNGASDYILKDRLSRLPEAVYRVLVDAEAKWQLFRAKQALEASEARFRALVETSTDWIWEIDAQGRYTYSSPAVETLLGYTPEEVIGRTPFELMPHDEAEWVSHCFAEIAAARQPINQLENVCLHRDGHRVILETSGVPVFAPDGTYAGYHGIDRDITQRKQVEVALRESEALKHAILDSMAAEIAVLDREGVIVAVNGPWRRFALENGPQPGVAAPHTEIGANYLGICHDSQGEASEGVHQAEAGIKAVLERRQSEFSLEYPCHSPAQQRWFHMSVTPLDGEGVVVTHSNISERKQSEAVLALQARRAEALLELPRAAERLDEAAFMQRGQELAEELSGSEIAFIHFVHDDQETIELVAWSRRTLESYCRAAYDSHYPVSQAGIWADALRQRAPVVVNDYPDAANKHGLPEGHAELSRLISVPVMEGGLVRMLAGVGNKATPYSDLDVETVQLIANEIWRLVRQRRVDQALRASEAHLRSVLRATPVGIGVARDRVFLDVNETVLRMSGYSREELIGQSSRILYPSEAEFEWVGREKYAQIRETGIGTVDTRWQRKDGEIRDIFLSSALTNPDDPGQGVTFSAQDITERKASAQSLRESEAKFRLLSENGVDCIFWIGPDGSFRYVSPACERITGYSVAEFLADPGLMASIIHADERAAYVHHLADMTQADEAVAEYRIVRKDGSECWIAHHCLPMFDEDGTFLGRRGSNSDISVRKRSEIALRESEARFRRVSENSSDMIWLYDLTRDRFAFLSPSVEKQRGYTVEEALGQSLHEVLTPESYRRASGLIAATLAAFASGDESVRTQVHEFEQTRKDGSTMPVEVVATLVRDDQGKVTQIQGVSRDISERKRAELMLSKLAQAVEQSPESIVITDLNGHIEYVNEAFVRSTGYSLEEAIGQNPRILHSGKTPKATYDAFWDAMAHGRPWKGEFCNRRKDGSEYFEFAIITPLRQPDGSISHYVAVKEDITEKKRVAIELDQHRLHLEELVDLRTIELRASQQEAERLARVKSEFLANMSHEIRTPLNAVLGFAQVGLRDCEREQTRETFARILSSGQLLLNVVNDILDFSKIEAGKLSIERGTLHPGAILDRCADLVRDSALNKGLELRLEAAADLPATCRGDEHRLMQVLMNLLSNAIKFTARGRITLSASRGAEQLRFRVADTGIGMSSEEQARLFLPFEQADTSTTRRFGGTGLGLAISKRLLELMDGHIEVNSVPGQGSVFEVYLPLLDPEGLASRRAAAVGASAAEPAGLRLRGISILVAEDNEVNRLVLEQLLSREGCRLTQAENGLLALEQVQAGGADAFDLVLMDIQMPEMGGIEATRRIKDIAPHLPIIGLTAHALAEERELCLSAGMAEHVAKPIVLPDLLRAIRKHVRGIPDAPAMAFPAASAKVEGIDWLALEAHYRNDREFFGRLLNTIAESNHDKPESIRAAIEAHDFKQLAFLTHSLKGMAGDILPEHTRNLAGLAEAAARKEEEAAFSHAAFLAESLRAFLAEIVSYLGHGFDATTGKADQPLDWAEIDGLLERLSTLLARSDTAANALQSQSAIQLRQAFGVDAERLGREIQGFDYESALESLKRLQERRRTEG